MIKSDSENSISNPTFKVLRYETSVYQYFIELKKDSLTSNGYLDLAKVPGLYVIGAGSFLKSIRTKNKLSQRTIAKALGVSSMQISQWERNINKMPLNYLIKLAKNLDINKETIYSFNREWTI
jgi:DNA-binding XRE family transcriptional regulator